MHGSSLLTTNISSEEATMAAVAALDIASMTAEDYSRILDQIGVEKRPAGGICQHIAHATDNGYRIIEIWDDKAGLELSLKDTLWSERRPTSDQGRRHRACQQDRADGLGHDGQGGALQTTRSACAVTRSRRITGVIQGFYTREPTAGGLGNTKVGEDFSFGAGDRRADSVERAAAYC
jgi:hypothetical protein